MYVCVCVCYKQWKNLHTIVIVFAITRKQLNQFLNY